MHYVAPYECIIQQLCGGGNRVAVGVFLGFRQQRLRFFVVNAAENAFRVGVVLKKIKLRAIFKICAEKLTRRNHLAAKRAAIRVGKADEASF
jgi:hypothetical protein